VAKKSRDRRVKSAAARSVSVAPCAQLFRFGPSYRPLFWKASWTRLKTRGAVEAPVRRIGSGAEAGHGLTPGGDSERHPTIDNVNVLLGERLSPTEHICRRIAAMMVRRRRWAAIVTQFVWIGNRHASTARDGQWMIATRQRKPRPIGI
jgi:hypothetical protein